MLDLELYTLLCFRETFYGVDATEEIPAPRVKRPPLLKQFSIMSAGTTAAVAGDADKKKSSEGKVQMDHVHHL